MNKQMTSSDQTEHAQYQRVSDVEVKYPLSVVLQRLHELKVLRSLRLQVGQHLYTLQRERQTGTGRQVRREGQVQVQRKRQVRRERETGGERERQLRRKTDQERDRQVRRGRDR